MAVTPTDPQFACNRELSTAAEYCSQESVQAVQSRRRKIAPLMSPCLFGHGAGMYGVELYAAVRLAIVGDVLSHTEADRRFGIDRRTVKKLLSHSAPPAYRRAKPVRRPKLDGSPASSTRSFRRTSLRCCSASSGTRRIGFSSVCGGSQPPRPTFDRNPDLIRFNPLIYREDLVHPGRVACQEIPMMPRAPAAARHFGTSVLSP